MELFIKLSKLELTVISNALLSHKRNVEKEIIKRVEIYSESNELMILLRKEMACIEKLQLELEDNK